MRFLNRVHFDSEMYPLELEMYHQIKNVIGVDPQLYEVIFMRSRVRISELTRVHSRSSCSSLTPIPVSCRIRSIDLSLPQRTIQRSSAFVARPSSKMRTTRGGR